MSERKPFAAGHRPLALPFINKIDAWLLKNKPGIWASRVHLFLYYLLLYAVVFLAALWLISSDPLERSRAEISVAFCAILSFLVLVIGLIYLFRFNVFKRFGDGSSGSFFLNFLFFFFCLILLASINTLPFWIEKWKANAAFPDEQIVRDLNNYNVAVAVLEREYLHAYETVDTLIVVESAELEDYLSSRLTVVDSNGFISQNQHKIYNQRYEVESACAIADSCVQVGK
ncbi:MAG: hypothetical protein ACRCYO_00025, partial [Bacteroidia bacterium]